MPPTHILVVSSKNTLHPKLQSLSPDFSVQLLNKPNGEGTPRILGTHLPDILFIDACDGSSWEGLALARTFRTAQPHLPIIILTPEGSEDFALAVLRAGINDYLKEPFTSDELSASITRCLGGVGKTEPATVPRPASSPYIVDNLIGESPTMKELREYITRVSETDSNVLITGETGTGKELVARLIHENSARRKSRLSVSTAQLSPIPFWKANYSDTSAALLQERSAPTEGRWSWPKAEQFFRRNWRYEFGGSSKNPQGHRGKKDISIRGE